MESGGVAPVDSLGRVKFFFEKSRLTLFFVIQICVSEITCKMKWFLSCNNTMVHWCNWLRDVGVILWKIIYNNFVHLCRMSDYN